MDSIKVLWVDDQSFEPIENIADKYGIDITHVKSWEEAKPYLQGFRFEDWSAIILDCYCKMTPNGPEDTHFLRKVFDELRDISNKRLLPWYILSQGGRDGFESIIDNQLNLEQRMLWDSDWEKIYYSKSSGDYIPLLKNIQEMAPKLPNYKVRWRFCDVFKVLSNPELFSHQAEEIMFPVLKSLYCPEYSQSFNPIIYYNQLRQAVECLFRSCHRKGLLPDVFIDAKTGVNLRWSSMFLAGKHAKNENAGKYYRYGDEDEFVFPPAIELSIRNILDIANSNSHTVDLSDVEKCSVEKYFSDSSSGQYVIYSMALSLCSVFVWYQQYISSHSDVEANKAKWKIFPLDNEIPSGSNSVNAEKEQRETSDSDDGNLCKEDYEGQTMSLEIDVIDGVDVAHCGPCALRGNKAKYMIVGQMVRLYDVKDNIFSESKDVYPYSAKYEKA